VGRPVTAGCLWADLPDGASGPERPPLPGDTSCDVVVVGAGFTGLWTAYYLLEVVSQRIRSIPGVVTTETFVYLKLRKQTYSWGVR